MPKVCSLKMLKRVSLYLLWFKTVPVKKHISRNVFVCREMWSAVSKRLCHYPEWIKFVQQFGNDGTQVRIIINEGLRKKSLL